MPFTPIHMGPGMAVKAAAPRYFSIVVFGLAQISPDLEVLWYLAKWNPPLMRFWHTYLGATIVAVIVALLGKPVGQFIKSAWSSIARRCTDVNLSVSVPISWLASVSGAIVGVYSHILIDSLCYPDIEPLWPWSTGNPLFGLVSPTIVQVVCVLLGVVGLAWFFGREIRVRKAEVSTQT